MEDDIDNLDNISELKLLESLDLGHRKVFKEEEKKKENDEFVENINLLLSKLNERINIIKNLPKLEIKPFDLDSIKSNKSNKSNKPRDQNQIPNSLNPPNTMNNKLGNLTNTNNFANNTFNTPYPIEGSIDYNLKNKQKFVIPDSINEKTNVKLNKLNNNNIINGNNNINNENNNINNAIPGENYIEGE